MKERLQQLATQAMENIAKINQQLPFGWKPLQQDSDNRIFETTLVIERLGEIRVSVSLIPQMGYIAVNLFSATHKNLTQFEIGRSSVYVSHGNKDFFAPHIIQLLESLTSTLK